MVEEVQDHFTAFKRCKDWWGIADDFDETGFQIGVTSSENVQVPMDTASVYATDPDDKELITSVETVN